LNKLEDPKVIEKIRKILEDSNRNDPWILARQIYKEVIVVELELEASKWQSFGFAHRYGRKGH